MDDAGKREQDEAGKISAEQKQAPRAELDRMRTLPLDALLYYVLYGDERLTKLT